VKKRKTVILIFLTLILTIIAFLPSFENGFTNWDDNELVTSNTIIMDLSWHNIKTIFTTFYLSAYIPLTILSYSLEYHFFKLDPRAYHTTNIVLHLFNCLLVFWLIYKLSSNIYISFVTTILFAIHPLRVESVAWITGRKDVLYSFLFLGALLSYLYYRGKQVIKYYWLSLFLFILSVLAKGMAVTFPFVLLLCDYLFHRKFNKYLLLEKIPFFVIALVFGVIAILGERSFEDITTTSSFIFFDKVLIVSYGLLFYLTKIAVPVKLSCYYPYPEKIGGFLPPIFFFSFIIIVGLIIAVILTKKYTRKVIFGSLFFLIAILPYLQLIRAGQLIANRYIYIPSIGLFYMVGTGFFWLYTRKLRSVNVLKSVLGIIFIGIVGVLSFITFNQCRIWKDSMTLWNNVLDKYPNVPVAYNNRGTVYYDKGEYDKAVTEFTLALKYNPNYVRAYYNLGITYDAKGEYDRAIIELNKALMVNPKYAAAYNNRGLIYGRVGEYDKAIADLTKALKINPKYAEAYCNRGITYGRIEKYDRAIVDFTEALRNDHKYAEAYYNRAIAYFLIKEYEKAWQDVRKSEGLGYPVDPNFLELLIETSKGQHR